MRTYEISVQRRREGERWHEIGRWTVRTIETGAEQQGLLNAGLREGWRVVVRETAASAAVVGGTGK